jgi:hypothetical protein
MTEERRRITVADALTAKTTAERLKHITDKELRKGVIVYMPPNRVAYKIVGFTGPGNQWVQIRPENEQDSHLREVDPRVLSKEQPPRRGKDRLPRHR